jgi:hypothetical protein
MPLILAGDKPLARSFAARRKGRPDQDYFAQVWLRQVPDAENVTNPALASCRLPSDNRRLRLEPIRSHHGTEGSVQGEAVERQEDR